MKFTLMEIAEHLGCSEAALAMAAQEAGLLDRWGENTYDAEARDAIEWAWEQTGGDACPKVTAKVVRKKWSYAAYLDSAHWQDKRIEALKYYGWSCCLCGIGSYKSRLDVHHRRYRGPDGKTILGRETVLDLSILCHKCHTLYENSKAATK